MSSKQIVIPGVKKNVRRKVIIDATQNNLLSKKDLNVDMATQKNILCALQEKLTNSSSIEQNVLTFVTKELNNKLNSYKHQDKKNNIYDSESFITEEELLEKLIISKSKCNYCEKNVKIIYEQKRDDYQWTLDRIFNSVGHSCKNTVISCLKCNLDRKIIHQKKFIFTKKMVIHKLDN